METRDDVFAASSTAQMARMVDFVSIKEENYGTFFADCIKAYYQADQIEEVCVAPPSEYLAARAALGLRTDVLWYLKKMLPGQRTGGAAWIATAKSRLETRGYERNQASPQFYFHRKEEARALGVAHGRHPRRGAEQGGRRRIACSPKHV